MFTLSKPAHGCFLSGRFAAAAGCWFLLVSVTFGRTWTDLNGRQVEAELVAVKARCVSVKRISDERIFDVPLELFSEVDQAYVARVTRPLVLDEAAIKRFVIDVAPYGQGCGGTTFAGKPVGAFWNFYEVYLPGFRAPQELVLGYVQDAEKGNFLYQFSGPGFKYTLANGALLLKR